MDKNRKVHQFKNPVLNWIEFRLPIISYFKKEYIKKKAPPTAKVRDRIRFHSAIRHRAQ